MASRARPARRTRPARTRPIGLRLAGLLVIPLISLAGLGAFAASVTVGPAIQEHNYDRQYATVVRPALTLGIQLAQERLQSFIWLNSGRRASPAQLHAQRRRTDAAAAATRAGAAKAQRVLSGPARAPLATFLDELGQLGEIRKGVDTRSTGPLEAFQAHAAGDQGGLFGIGNAPVTTFISQLNETGTGNTSALDSLQAYSELIDTEYEFYDVAIAVPDASVSRDSAASAQAQYALELVGREAALVDGAFASGGRMSRVERQLFAQTAAIQREVLGQALARLSPDLRARYAQAYDTSAYGSFSALEDQITATASSSGPIPFGRSDWQSASQPFVAALTDASNTEGAALENDVGQLGNRLLVRLALAGGLGLLAVAASVFLLARFSRRLVRELTGLRMAARSIADERLPRLVHRLRLGEDVDVESESPPVPGGKTTEVAAVAQAFSTVQRTAVEAAVGQAELRSSVSQVFLNLARRSQSLLHRQLRALDVMERQTSDPEALAELFRLDHLTTRMRRYAESLIILSGNPPGRGWSRPVSVIDVLRAAVSEVEDYTRVDVIGDSDEGITGTAVADVIHLIAELVENATSFSPPNTKVVVRGEQHGHGFWVEIEDQGLGIDPDNLRAINERLESRPEFDVVASDQIGLFVVGQLAARHGIRVSLRPTPQRGTNAIVLLPHSIMASPGELNAAADGRYGARQPTADGRDPGIASGAAKAGLPGTGSAGLPRRGSAGLPGRGTAGLPRRGGAGVSAGGVAPISAPGRSSIPAALEPADPPERLPVEPSPREPLPLEPLPREPLPLEPLPREPLPREPLPREPLPREPLPPAPAPGGTYLGLPRRQRQASLAPGLRDEPRPAGEETGGRSPEELRALMTSIQRGWQRGRADADDLAGTGADGPAGTRADGPAGTRADGPAGTSADSRWAGTGADGWTGSAADGWAGAGADGWAGAGADGLGRAGADSLGGTGTNGLSSAGAGEPAPPAGEHPAARWDPDRLWEARPQADSEGGNA